MDEPETWRWIWLATAVTFGVGEIAMAGSFFLAPFAVGAAVACILAFFDVGITLQWVAFVAISSASFAALRPIAKRLDAEDSTDGIGANRLIGSTGTVLEAIPGGAGEVGLVRVDREEWRAEAADGRPLPVDTPVRIIKQRGTRVVVTAVTETADDPTTGLPAHPPTAPPTA